MAGRLRDSRVFFQAWIVDLDTHRGMRLAWISHSLGLYHRWEQRLHVGVFLKLGKVSLSLADTLRAGPHSPTHSCTSLGENE